MEPDGAFATDARYLCAFAISGRHANRDQAGLREVNLVDAITWLPKHGAFPKIMLPRMLVKRRRDHASGDNPASSELLDWTTCVDITGTRGRPRGERQIRDSDRRGAGGR
jgi:hypothetical protein